MLVAVGDPGSTLLQSADCTFEVHDAYVPRMAAAGGVDPSEHCQKTNDYITGVKIVFDILPY